MLDNIIDNILTNINVVQDKRLKEIIAENVIRLRNQRFWTQEDLAQKASLHRTHVAGIEKGKMMPTKATLEKLASAFDIQMDDLVKIQDDLVYRNSIHSTTNVHSSAIIDRLYTDLVKIPIVDILPTTNMTIHDLKTKEYTYIPINKESGSLAWHPNIHIDDVLAYRYKGAPIPELLIGMGSIILFSQRFFGPESAQFQNAKAYEVECNGAVSIQQVTKQVNGMITLFPANIVVSPEEVVIYRIVIAVMHEFSIMTPAET